MSAVGKRQVSLLLLSVAMVVVGVLGLINAIAPTQILAGLLLVTALFLAASLGRRSVNQ